MLLHLAQGRHSADAELVFGLLDRIQTKIAKVDGRVEGMGAHLQPHHAPDHAVTLLLIELPRLFQALRAHVFLEGNNVTRPVT